LLISILPPVPVTVTPPVLSYREQGVCDVQDLNLRVLG
jgi:hypothetical protein